MESELEDDATCEVGNSLETPVDVSSSDTELHEGSDGPADCDLCSAPYPDSVRVRKAESRHSVFHCHSGAEDLVHSYSTLVSELSSSNVEDCHARALNREERGPLEPAEGGAVASCADAGSCSAPMHPGAADATFLSMAKNRHFAEILSLAGSQPCSVAYGGMSPGMLPSLGPMLSPALGGNAPALVFSPHVGMGRTESEVAVQVEEVLDEGGDSEYADDRSEHSGVEEPRSDTTTSRCVHEAASPTDAFGLQQSRHSMALKEASLRKCLEKRVQMFEMHRDARQSCQSSRLNGEKDEARKGIVPSIVSRQTIDVGGVPSCSGKGERLLWDDAAVEKGGPRAVGRGTTRVVAVENQEETPREQFDAPEDGYQEDEEEILENEDDDDEMEDEREENEENVDDEDEEEEEDEEDDGDEEDQEDEGDEEDQEDEGDEEDQEDEKEDEEEEEEQDDEEDESFLQGNVAEDFTGAKETNNTAKTSPHDWAVDVRDASEDIGRVTVAKNPVLFQSRVEPGEAAQMEGCGSQPEVAVLSNSEGNGATTPRWVSMARTHVVAPGGDIPQRKCVGRSTEAISAACEEPSLPPAETPALGVTPTASEYRKQLLTLSRSAWGSSGLAELQSRLNEEKSPWDLENLRTGGLEQLLRYKSPFAPERQRQKRKTIHATVPDAKRVEYVDKRTLAVTYKSTLESDRILAKNLGGWDTLFALRGQLASIDRDLLEQMVLELCCVEPRVISKIAECCVRTTNRTVLAPR